MASMRAFDVAAAVQDGRLGDLRAWLAELDSEIESKAHSTGAWVQDLRKELDRALANPVAELVYCELKAESYRQRIAELLDPRNTAR